MARTTSIAAALVFGLVHGWAWAQPGAEPPPAFTEVQRREIIKAAGQLTADRIPEITRRAEAGDAAAQVMLGIAYIDAKGVERDIATASRWFRVAADAGHPMAQTWVGFLYSTGQGVARDAAEAARWFRKAAARGYGQAMSHLGWAYYRGDGVETDVSEALRLFRSAAMQGNASAQNRLGVAYAEGKGVAQDYAQAATWYRKAAEQGDLPAARNLGRILNYGYGVPKDYAEAARWFRTAAAEGDPGAQVDLAIAHVNGEGVPKSKDEAERWLKTASDRGYAIASYLLGQLYWEKRHSLAILVAMDRFEKAAAEGYAPAAYRIGKERGSRFARNPIGKDDLASCTWLLIAAGIDRANPDVWVRERPADFDDMRRELPGRIEKARKSLKPDVLAGCEARAAEWLTAHPMATTR